MSKCSVILPSHNKKKYVKDAIDSVINQTFKDFSLYIVENSTDDTKSFVHEYIKQLNDTRIKLFDEDYSSIKELYPTAVLLNKYFDLMDGEYIFFLADDDILYPSCLEKAVAKLQSTNVCYWALECTQGKDGQFAHINEIKAETVIAQRNNVDCMLDSGQVAFRKTCLEKLQKPYYREALDVDSSHCDGLFLQKLANEFEFQPINEKLSEKRRTDISVFVNA
jgi:spore maturation protein CgeD